MAEEVELGSPADEEENERKLLGDTSEDDNEVDEKVDDENEVLASDLDNQEDDSRGDSDGNEEEANKRNEQDEADVDNIKSKLDINPYDYDAHKQLIDKLHQMNDFDRLRAARENMNSKYPLTPELWLTWLRDEMKIAVTMEQKESVIKLCERAIQDYLSVEVWLEYLQFSTGLGTEKETIEKIRNLFERALTAAGLHVTKGALIWDAFREFENFIALMMDDSTDEEKRDQINRIGKLYRRQLACPLYGMEKTFEEYGIWRCSEGCDCTEDESILKSGYEKALTKLNTRLPFEEKLESAQNDSILFNFYKAYLISEKQIGDPGRVTVLYERAVTDLSLEPSLWLDYLQYVEKSLKIDAIVETVYSRATKNVPGCAKIWQNWIRYYEKQNKPLPDVQKLMENALNVTFYPEEYKNLWLIYLEFLRRRYDQKSNEEEKRLEMLRNAFNRACEHLASFGGQGDPNYEILQYWARTEAIHANNMEKTRTLWADIMSLGHSETAVSWLEYISLERCYGDTKHLRKLFQKALISCKDWPETIGNAWINFERDEGTLEQMETCELKIKERLEKIAEERKKSLSSKVYEEISTIKKGNKRKVEDPGKWKNLGVSSSKVSRTEKSKSNTEKKSSHEDSDKPKTAPPPGYEEVENENMGEESHQEVDNTITIFVSNLDYTATEEEIREALKSVGPITLFKMVKDYKGRSKGFCYVQLTSPQVVEEALKLDRTPVNGRPMYISRCDPNKTSRGQVFKYKTDLEKNKLFIKGLPPSTTKEQLEEIFKIYGNVKDVRVVTYRNGHSKGLAYVDFEDENSASKALVATDGMTIEDKIISVAISQPPQRKHVSDNEESHSVRSLGGSSTSRSTFGNPKTILSLVPTTIKRKANNGSEISGNGVPPSKSNADFRNMLLNKK